MAQRRDWESLSDAYRKRLTRKLGLGDERTAKFRYEAGESLKTARGHKDESAIRAPTQYGFVWVRGLRKHDRELLGQAWEQIRRSVSPLADDETQADALIWLTEHDGMTIGNHKGVSFGYPEDYGDPGKFHRTAPGHLRLNFDEAFIDELQSTTDVSWDSVYER